MIARFDFLKCLHAFIDADACEGNNIYLCFYIHCLVLITENTVAKMISKHRAVQILCAKSAGPKKQGLCLTE